MKKILLDKEFYFGIGFLNELLDLTGLRLDELGTQDEAQLIPKMMYCSLAYACKRTDKEVDFKLTDIFDLIDNNGGVGGQFWKDFQMAFYESMNKDVPADTKKKVARKK